MNRLIRTAIPVLALVLFAGCIAQSSMADASGDAARKEKILSNLKLKFPQLEQMGVEMGDIAASNYDGLDEGFFTVRGRQQKFLVAKDDTALYLVQGEPIDVSMTADQVKAELDKRAEEEARQAVERAEKLEAAIEGLPFRGSADAPVTIVEFSDFQCPYCTRGAATVEEILEKYPNDVKFVFKHFPLNFHPWAKPASIASICAGNQNGEAFWTLHDKYFEEQKQLTPENVLAKSREYLGGSGIDMAAWTACAEDTDSEEYKAASAQVDADMALGQSMGVTGTPGFFVNGEFLNGAQPLTAFEPLIAKAKGDASGS